MIREKLGFVSEKPGKIREYQIAILVYTLTIHAQCLAYDLMNTFILFTLSFTRANDEDVVKYGSIYFFCFYIFFVFCIFVCFCIFVFVYVFFNFLIPL